ncbi:MAG: YHS domain-containing protein [Gammaproteobacteria bacterium]|jgi:YHS domain-containing protein|nr:YHS domain-containing protein [Gammaproteobacteria bacterium]
MRYGDTKCPVCGMEVDRHQLELEYRGMHFAFCSEQCRERFETDPHLYVGSPGHRAPKAEGRESLKRRRLQLAEPLSDEMAARIRGALMTMMGGKGRQRPRRPRGNNL